MPDPDWLRKAREDGRILSEVWASDLAPEETPCRPDGNPPGITAGNVTTPSEAEFGRNVLALAELHGWTRAHFRAARVLRGGRETYETPVDADGKGFLDLVLVRERVVWAELKSEKGRLTPDQRKWLKVLADAGQEVYVWRPNDWNLIRRVLTERRGDR